jgi:hypothetical protein
LIDQEVCEFGNSLARRNHHSSVEARPGGIRVEAQRNVDAVSDDDVVRIEYRNPDWRERSGGDAVADLTLTCDFDGTVRRRWRLDDGQVRSAAQPKQAEREQ